MASTEEPGKFKIIGVSADGGRDGTFIQGHTGTVSIATKSVTDRRTLLPLSFQEGGFKLDEGGQVQLHFASDAADIIESEECDLWLDCALINKNSGVVTPMTLTLANMTGFTPAGTVDVTYTVAGIYQELCYYTVPSGCQFVVGNRNDPRLHLYIGDDS